MFPQLIFEQKSTPFWHLSSKLHHSGTVVLFIFLRIGPNWKKPSEISPPLICSGSEFESRRGSLKLISVLPKRHTFNFPSAVILSRLQVPQKLSVIELINPTVPWNIKKDAAIKIFSSFSKNSWSEVISILEQNLIRQKNYYVQMWNFWCHKLHGKGFLCYFWTYFHFWIPL